MNSTVLWQAIGAAPGLLAFNVRDSDQTINLGQTIAMIVPVVIVILLRYRGVARVAFIENPVLGFLDLSAGQSTAELNSDRETLRGLFTSILESTSSPPKCHVLFVYCQIEADGSVRGSDLGLRELIRESGDP